METEPIYIQDNTAVLLPSLPALSKETPLSCHVGSMGIQHLQSLEPEKDFASN